MSGSVDLSNADIKGSWGELTENKGDVNWVLWGFEKGTQKLELVGKGTGGFKELKTNLDEDRVLFGGFKVLGEDRQPNLTAHRLKAIFFTFIGSKVGPLQKGKVTFQSQAIVPVATGLAASISLNSSTTIEDIGSTLLRSGGAHKPTHYVFGGDEEVEVSSL